MQRTILQQAAPCARDSRSLWLLGSKTTVLRWFLKSVRSLVRAIRVQNLRAWYNPRRHRGVWGRGSRNPPADALRKQQQIIIRVRCPDNYSWLLLLLAKSANGASNPVVACCLLKANASVKSKPVRQDTSARNIFTATNEALYWSNNHINGALGESVFSPINYNLSICQQPPQRQPPHLLFILSSLFFIL